MTDPTLPEHHCVYRAQVETLTQTVATLTQTVAQLQAELEALRRTVFGKRSEKMPSIAQALGRSVAPEQTQQNRAARRKKRETMETETIACPLPPAQRVCPKCQKPLQTIGHKMSEVYGHVPAKVVRKVYVRESCACRCGEYVVTAKAPERLFDRSAYDASFVAHVVVSKCVDSIPLYRVEQRFRRLGLDLSRSTMNALFHQAARWLKPLADRIVAQVAEAAIVQADETTVRQQDRRPRSFLWVFRTATQIGFRFSPTRAGLTPFSVLGQTAGFLVVDGYSGYNDTVGLDGGRIRVGCYAHARRGFFEALQTAPEAAQAAMDFIRALYRVEYQALDQGLQGTEAHRRLRQTESQPILEALHAFLCAQQPLHLPKGPMGRAIAYALNQWTALTQFLSDPRLPLDNNRSENALRVAALGRKNFLFVANQTCGENLAVLYTLTATCKACGIDPQQYLEDVLPRLSTHPHAELDALLPHRWASLANARDAPAVAA